MADAESRMTQEDGGQAPAPARLETFFAEVRTMLAWWRTGLSVTTKPAFFDELPPMVRAADRWRGRD